MRKSDFNLKFYTMSYLFCLLNFIFRKVLGFNDEIYFFPEKPILYTLKWDIVGVIPINICWDMN